MTADNETPPCPFCGMQRTQTIEVDSSQWAVVCDVCGAIGPIGLDLGEAARKWGQRSSRDAEASPIAAPPTSP